MPDLEELLRREAIKEAQNRALGSLNEYHSSKNQRMEDLLRRLAKKENRNGNSTKDYC